MGKKRRNIANFFTRDGEKPVDPFTGELLVPVKELQEAVRQIPNRMGEGIPKTKDRREYVVAPSSKREQAKYRFFNRALKVAAQQGEYALPNKGNIPISEISAIFKATKYLHPDVFEDLNKEFSEKKVAVLPITEDGREYTPAPSVSDELTKRIFFDERISAAQEAGFYSLQGKNRIPLKEIAIVADLNTGRKKYLHPDVYSDLDKKFSKERNVEIPVTGDGREYVLAPSKERGDSRTKWQYFTNKIREAITRGKYTLRGESDIPAVEITAFYKAKKYIHPDIVADIEIQFSREKHEEVPKLKDGRSYVLAPQKGEAAVYFYDKRIKNAQAAGRFLIEDKDPIPADLISIIYKNQKYLHPDVESSLKKTYWQGRVSEIPKTKDGREYVQQPNQANAKHKYVFFKKRLQIASAGDAYLLKNSTAIPAEEISSIYQTKRYIHPDIVEDLERRYAESSRDGLPDKPKHMLEKKLRVQKTSPTVKIGDADEAKLSLNLRGELEQKLKKQRGK